MVTTFARSAPDRWHKQIEAAQANQRRIMARETNSCPECGACSRAYQRDCIKCVMRHD